MRRFGSFPAPQIPGDNLTVKLRTAELAFGVAVMNKRCYIADLLTDPDYNIVYMLYSIIPSRVYLFTGTYFDGGFPWDYMYKYSATFPRPRGALL